MLAELTNDFNDKEEAIKINSLTLKDLIRKNNEENAIKSLIATSEHSLSENNINILFDISIIKTFNECRVSLKEENGEQKVVFSFKK